MSLTPNLLFFQSPPAPTTLHWLSNGLLESRFLRTIRLWYCLQNFYGPRQPLREPWPETFSYPVWRDRSFAPSHDRQELATSDQILATCHGKPCLCQHTALSLLWGAAPPSPDWHTELAHISHLSRSQLDCLLQERPFAIVHRALRNDLKALAEQGWLQKASRGCYRLRSPQDLPFPPEFQHEAALSAPQPHLFQSLSSAQGWDVIRALESVAFLQPSLEPIIEQIWQHQATQTQKSGRDPAPQRIFFEVNYILSEADQERVDTYQDQLEHLWQSPEGAVVRFESWVPQRQHQGTATVYPVCLHYTRRAKYLSAYGDHADGSWGWHNYRLDRIRSEHLQILPWGDPQVPSGLRSLWRSGQLPQPDYVRRELEAAWGFNFYLPKAPLILRFNCQFAQDYVAQTQRHGTFLPIAYDQILPWLKPQLTAEADLKALLKLLTQRSPTDAYFRAWIRLDDINVTLRLREWRPAGEVIYPFSLRRALAAECREEAQYYTKSVEPETE
ncbi:MAG: TIGR03985 family CRISPR-associated protein [Prochlorothrix sp.]|nr:TIGR03985 family CRISPR-associated protein [Prochlorothrix sp.]